MSYHELFQAKAFGRVRDFEDLFSGQMSSCQDNRRADLSTCGSLENGVIHLYNRICSRANAAFDLWLGESDVNALLRGETAGFPPVIAQLAEQQAQGFIQDLFGTPREYQLDLRTGTVLFMGGVLL